MVNPIKDRPDFDIQDIFVILWRFAFVQKFTVKKSTRKLALPLIYSISKLKIANKACQHVNICLETKFLIFFSNISLVALQFIHNKKC